jgi:hypothetical protein
MPAALVISAAQNKAEAGAEFRSFEQIFATRVGLGYAISDPDRRKISIGCTVVVLDNARCLRAEAKLSRLELNEKTRSGMQRYHVHFEEPKTVEYKYERINRWGTSVTNTPGS